jgi:hypothetical protein
MHELSIIPKILFFRFTKEDIHSLNRTHFIIGLVGTWFAGIGRYWDHPNAEPLQYAGLGSVIYIFILALLIYITVLPYKLAGWSYFKVLTFISLTSFPAILYAIPVEKFMPMNIAASMNAWFLGIVALWRLALLFRLLYKYDNLEIWHVSVIALFPMCFLITTLTALNLEKVVFNIMGGLRETTGRENAYTVLMMLSYISLICFLPLLLAYIIGIFTRKKSSS